MKKRILAITAALMLFAGVATASSTWGTYNGNPVVRVTSGSTLIQADEVPAMIMDGKTMVPISMLRQLGATVTWDQDTYTVDVNVPSDSSAITVDTLVKVYGPKGKKHLLSYAEYMSNGDGFSQVNLVTTFNINENAKDFQELLILAGAVGAVQMRVEDKSDTIKFIKTADFVSFVRGEITTEEYVSRIQFVNKTTPIASVPLSSSPTTSDIIESKIDGDFEGWDGETIFKLSNSQVWQQDSYDYHYHYAYSPDVLIYKSGSRYKMKVKGVDEEIFVKRIK